MAKQKNSDLMVRIIKDSAVWQYLPDPNTIITDFGSNLLIYDKMKLDSRIGSLFDDRRNATHNLGISITTPEDESVAEYAAKYLTEANLRKWGFFLLDGALTYGFRPAEIVWKEDQDGYMFIDGLIGHDICRYRYTQEGQLNYGTHECSEDYRWIVHACEGDSLNRPYGRAYLKRVYWAWRFKKLGWEFWMSATEKFAVPSLIALFDQSDPDKAQAVANNLADLIRQVSSGSGGALANIKGIQQISMGGSVSDFNTLITACDLQIAYGMTGQALATNVSDTGTQALGTVQERTKASAYENDARALAYTLNKLISMAIEINFGADAEKPIISFDTEDYASFSEVMQAYQQGVPISRKALYSRYGLPEPEDEDDAITYTPPITGFEFADTGKKKTPDPYTGALKAEGEKAKKLKAIEDKYYDEVSKGIESSLMELKTKADENPDILSDETFKIWKPKPDMAIVEATYKAMMEAWLLGLKYAKGSDSSNFADADICMSFDLKYEDAVKIAGSRKAVTPSDYRKLSEHIKQQAFTVGRLAQLDMVNKAKAVYMKAIEAEKVGDIGSFVKDMAAVDSNAAGFVGYYQMVYRTNLQSDYNAAKAWKFQEDPPAFLQFVAIEDERTSDICSAKAGVTLPYSDTFWDSNWPPLHYNCRSTVRSIDTDEAREMGLLNRQDKLVKRIKPKDIVKPQGTFGKKPTKDNAFWGATPSQHARIAADMIEDEINDVAGRTVCSDFYKPKEGYTYVETAKGGLRYENSLKDAQEFKNNIKIADTIVNDKGCYIELQKADGPKFSKNCDGWVNGVEKLEFKTLSSTKSRNIAEELMDGFNQADTVAVSISKENKTILGEAIKRMGGTIGKRRPYAKGIYIVIDDKATYIPVMDFKDEDKIYLSLDITNKT